MKVFVFPGQGSQFVGMGKELAGRYPVARSTFEEADDMLGFKLSRLCFDGPEKELGLTENTQPAILATSIAILRVLQTTGRDPDLVAGHSLGEYSAVVCAGGMDFGEALRVVRERGRLMQEAVPVGQGGMAAIFGLDEEQVLEICEEEARSEVVTPANLNGAGQIVIAGHVEAVQRVTHLADRRGARRVVLLPVSAPFHCRLMMPAQKQLKKILSKVRFKDLQYPLVNNVDAEVIQSAPAVRDGLIRQVSSPVRWEACVREMISRGATSVHEIGPGRVLTGMVRRIERSINAISIGTLDQIEANV
jgi:[acyl-carrier-protein] S-malonyltransferase